MQFYHAILRTLTNCHQVWNFCTKLDRRKLERIQDCTLRIVFKDNSATYDELLKKAGLTTLYNLRLQDLAILMFKVKHKLTPTYIQNMFEENGTTYQLRNGNDFKIPRFRTVRETLRIRYMGPHLWSRLASFQEMKKTVIPYIPPCL